MTDIRFVVPEASPSQNEFFHKHWRVEYSAKKKWALMLLAAMPRDRAALKATGKRLLTVERHGKRTLDYPNLIGGLKGILDNLVEFGLLVDDKPACLDLHAVQVKLERGEEPHTVFVLEDVP